MYTGVFCIVLCDAIAIFLLFQSRLLLRLRFGVRGDVLVQQLFKQDIPIYILLNTLLWAL